MSGLARLQKVIGGYISSAAAYIAESHCDHRSIRANVRSRSLRTSTGYVDLVLFPILVSSFDSVPSDTMLP
jgi:hypothetical protein